MLYAVNHNCVEFTFESHIFVLIASTTSLARHKIVWSTNHDVLLCREILVVEP